MQDPLALLLSTLGDDRFDRLIELYERGESEVLARFLDTVPTELPKEELLKQFAKLK